VKRSADILKQAALIGLKRETDTMVERTGQVVRQARARIFGGNTHVDGKIVSVLEPSTEVIGKGKAGKPAGFGKMVKVQEAENQIVTDYEVYDQKPGDTDLLVPAMERHEELTGRTPDLVAADNGFSQQRTKPLRTKRA
jgi:IS5 family transposase